MAKKTKSLQADADGSTRTGIYVTSKTPMTAENAKAYCAAFHRSAEDRVERIRENLLDFVMQYLEGPYSKEQYGKMTGTLQVVDTGEGNKVYRELPVVEDEAGKPHVLQYHNAIDALEEIRNIVANLDGNVDPIVRASINLGRLLERISIRPHEPNAKRGRKVLESARAGGKMNASLTDAKKAEATAKVALLIEKGKSQNLACEVVAKEYRVSKSTIKRAYLASKGK